MYQSYYTATDELTQQHTTFARHIRKALIFIHKQNHSHITAIIRDDRQMDNNNNTQFRFYDIDHHHDAPGGKHITADNIAHNFSQRVYTSMWTILSSLPPKDAPT